MSIMCGSVLTTGMVNYGVYRCHMICVRCRFGHPIKFNHKNTNFLANHIPVEDKVEGQVDIHLEVEVQPIVQLEVEVQPKVQLEVKFNLKLIRVRVKI